MLLPDCPANTWAWQADGGRRRAIVVIIARTLAFFAENGVGQGWIDAHAGIDSLGRQEAVQRRRRPTLVDDLVEVHGAGPSRSATAQARFRLDGLQFTSFPPRRVTPSIL